MNLKNLLLERKAAIVERWFRLILETYHPDTSSFMKREKDRFANPVGNSISHGVEAVFDELIQGKDPVEVAPLLDQIIRIRAVQDFNPSQAISFVLALKDAIRENLKDEIRDGQFLSEILILESRIDKLTLLSFDLYMKCREKLYELKTNQLRDSTARLLKRANLVVGIPEEEENPENGDMED